MKLRLYIFFILLAISVGARAQKITGVVIDAATKDTILYP